MKFKKTIVLATTATLAVISLAANANLTTYNYTNEDSSVRVTSGMIKPCSSQAGVYTPKMSADGTPGVSVVSDTEVGILCKTSTNNTCTADIYSSNNCTGAKVGEASLNMISKSVTQVRSMYPNYRFDVENNGTVLKIKYTS